MRGHVTGTSGTGEPSTVWDLLAARAHRDGRSIALRAGGEEWTLAELATAVDATASTLWEHGVRAGDKVVLHAARSVGAVITTLAVLRLGAAVAPLGGQASADAWAREAAAALAPRIVVTDDLAAFPAAIPLPDVADLGHASRGPLAVPPAVAGDLAYVLHTSGTTGRPKAVPVPHRALLGRLLWGQRLYPLGPGDVVLHWAAPVFDFAFWEVLAPLCFGATVVVSPEEAVAEPLLLGAIIENERVSCVHFVPSLLADFLAGGAGESLRAVRLVFYGGEALPPALARELATIVPGRMFNQYGPAEAGIDCTAWEISASDAWAPVVPIGLPRGDASTRVMDDSLREVPPGTAGTLYVGGSGLAWGYLGSGAQTAESFVPDPSAAEPGARLYRTGDRVRRRSDGVLEFLGRADRQVKVRGVRIELAEVEAALRRHPGIRHAAVTSETHADGRVRITAHLVARTDLVDPAELRRFVAAWLRAAAIPSHFVYHAEFPRLASGKVNLGALAGQPAALTGEGRDVPGGQGRQRVPTRKPGTSREATHTERQLMALWADLMKIDHVRASDDFFDLGGHSMLAMRMVARIWVTFRVRLSARAIFDAPTVAALAAVIDGGQEGLA